MRHQSVILPLRRDMPKLLRFHRAIERLAGWCSWRCPLLALLLVMAAHLFPTPAWWRAACDTLAAFLVALLFCSYGLGIATTAVVVERPGRWFERIGLLAGVFGGIALMAIGLIGAWVFFRNSLLGL
jgi:hypothetical protein